MSGASRTAPAICHVIGTLYLHDGTPAAGLRVEVRESALVGQPTAERMQVYYTEADGSIDIPAFQGSDIRVFAQARGFDVTCDGVWLAIPETDMADLGTLVPPDGFDPPTEVIVAIPTGAQDALNFIPPLVKTGVDVSLPKASATTDGYLAASDFVNFAAGQPPAGVDGDLQMKAGSNFAASLARQDLNISGNAAFDSAGDRSAKQGFLTHNTVTIKSPLTQNITGSALATGLRIMDTDDGAGNAQWFEMLGSYGAFNFQWQHTGTGAPSREFFIDNGRTRIVMHGFWRGSIDEGDQIALFTLDPSPHDSTNYQFLNGLVVSGEWHPMDSFGPGVYIKAHNNDSGYGYAYGYQFYFDHDGLNLPKDPVLPTHAATKSYVDAHASSGGGSPPAGSASELQYRASASAFGAIAGSGIGLDVIGQTALILPNSVRVAGTTTPSGGTLFTLETSFSSVTFAIRDGTGGLANATVFYAIHNGANAGLIYFGRSNGSLSQSARAISFYTSPTGTGDARRMFVSGNGSVVVNQASVSDQTAALTVNAAGPATFTKAFQCNGIGEMSADPTTPMGIATKQYVDAHAGGGGGGAPAGSATELQYRSSSTAFGAVAGSIVDTSGRVTIRGVTIDSNLLYTAPGSGSGFGLRNYGADINHYYDMQANVAANGFYLLNYNLDGTDIVDLNFETASTMALRLRAEMRSSICMPGGDFRFSTWGYSDVVIIGSGGLQINAGSLYAPWVPLYTKQVRITNTDTSFMQPMMEYISAGTEWDIGPATNEGSYTGSYVVIRAGKGNGTSGGSAYIHGPLERWYFYADIYPAAGKTFNIYDASTNSNPPMKIGPAGSGPGGVGRMIYVD